MMAFISVRQKYGTEETAVEAEENRWMVDIKSSEKKNREKGWHEIRPNDWRS